MKHWIRSLGLTVITLSVLSGCATRPMLVARKGLLDRGPSQERRDDIAGVSIRNGAGEAEADSIYAPKEGSKIELSGEWRWPLKSVTISSGYGDRGAKFHQGVDLRAPTGTPVLAAADGEVVYVGSKIRGYGRMVVIKHPGNFYTVYAHHSRNAVKPGRRVRMGQVIAYSGKSGHASGPHLHFELRRGTQSYDPEYALNHHIREFAGTDRHIATARTKN
jgi:murein DD-endopeptidase MepM/ murein hydrolase activator NlpD